MATRLDTSVRETEAISRYCSFDGITHLENAPPKTCYGSKSRRPGISMRKVGAIPLSVPLQKYVSDEKRFDVLMSESLELVRIEEAFLVGAN